MHPYTNRLAVETSPYLLQHAHNPVDWYPWGEEAFEKAEKEDKPVLVSIGYSACHWCHVMERESFENAEVAAIMNRHFVNIKVDREERPDVDHIYMDAVQAISGSGGWPLNVFLTPEKKPFYGGTYFPPQRAFNRSSWREVLLAVADAYQNRKPEINEQANNLTGHLQASNFLGNSLETKDFSGGDIDRAVKNLMKSADAVWGGFGNAPKFPQTFSINFLLTYNSLNKDVQPAGETSNSAGGQALLSLDKMLQGGIYDQIGGGFARYSTDTEWLVPHFEKMLYDNALLVMSLANAYKITKSEKYKDAIDETLAFIERELMLPESYGFFSALDADSEGEEGKFYVWQYDEVQEILGNAVQLFCKFYDISPEGNWTEANDHGAGRNIPRVKLPLEEFAIREGLDAQKLKAFLKESREKLLVQREKRIRPALDDKILLNWNALMNMAYSQAFAATGNEHYRMIAEKNMDFLLASFGPPGSLKHSWKNGAARHPAFLDDYASLVAALIELAQVTGILTYLHKAQEFIEVVMDNYADDHSPFFFYTHRMQTDVPVRKKELYDGATPSGNSMMAANLYRLSIFFDKQAWRTRAESMVTAMGEVAIKYPTSFGGWLSLLFEMVHGSREVSILGKNAFEFLGEIQKLFLPHSLIMASTAENDEWPLLKGRFDDRENHIYLCKNYVCKKPVSTVADFVKILNFK